MASPSIESPPSLLWDLYTVHMTSAEEGEYPKVDKGREVKFLEQNAGKRWRECRRYLCMGPSLSNSLCSVCRTFPSAPAVLAVIVHRVWREGERNGQGRAGEEKER